MDAIYIFEILRVHRVMLCIWFLGNMECLNLERLVAHNATLDDLKYRLLRHRSLFNSCLGCLPPSLPG